MIDQLRDGFFSPEEPNLFHPIVNALLEAGDYYMILADFKDYCDTQAKVDAVLAAVRAALQSRRAAGAWRWPAERLRCSNARTTFGPMRSMHAPLTC